MDFRINIFLPIVCLFLIGIFFFTKLYISYSTRFNILAKKNNRTLHKQEVPTGAGIIFSSSTVIAIGLMYYFGILKEGTSLYLSVCALTVAFFGFFDDLFNLNAVIKFIFQILSSTLVLCILYLHGISAFLDPPGFYFMLYICMYLFLLVWAINMFNFMDGINGFLSSCALIIVWSAAFLIYIQMGVSDDIIILFFVGLACLSFLFFNFNPAQAFMGDSGSMFLGFTVGALILKTTLEQDLEPWVWVILLGYFIGDCIPTTLYRLFYIKKWYKPHRSHAYQNLARVLDNHSKVTKMAIFYHLFWLFPLSLACLTFPQYCFLLISFSLLPVMLFNFIYGPRFSNS